MPKSDQSIRVEFADVLAGDTDPAAVDVVRRLDELGRPDNPWDALPRTLPAHRPPTVPSPQRHRGRSQRQRLGRAAQVASVLAVALISASLALAASGIINLGPLSNAVPDYGPPLGGFRHAGGSLREGLRPEVLFLTAPGWEYTDPEGWPLVKALSQFGRLSGLTPLSKASCGSGMCDQPGFDFRHVSFRSRYLALDSKEIVGIHGEPIQRLSARELNFFNRFASPLPRGNYVAAAMRAAAYDRLPLISIAGYVQTGSSFVSFNDFVPSQLGNAGDGNPVFVTFDQAQQTLATGKPVAGLQGSMIRNIDIETNILVALMCRADHLQPRSVCSRQTIAAILTHIR